MPLPTTTGNLHLNVTTPTFIPEVGHLLEPFIYEYVQRYGGSISAEHGIGLVKSKYLKYRSVVVVVW